MHIEEVRSFLKNKKVDFSETYNYGWKFIVPGRYYHFTFYVGHGYWLAYRVIWQHNPPHFPDYDYNIFKGTTLEQMYELMAFENYSAITIADNSAIPIEYDSIKSEVHTSDIFT